MASDKPFGAYAPSFVGNLILSLIQNSILKRGAFRPSMSRLMGDRPVDTIYQGVRFRLHHRDNGSELGVLFNPKYNATELDFLRERTPVGGIFVDIGANVGIFSVVMARHLGAKGRVIAIEPHPLACERLVFNASQLPIENLTLLQLAAGEDEGELKISTDFGNLGASHVSASGTDVKVRRLDAIMSDVAVTHIDSMKIDVEGYEDRVLMPFFKEAPASLWPTAIAIEHLQQDMWKSDCVGWLLQHGYRVKGKTRSNTLMVRKARL